MQKIVAVTGPEAVSDGGNCPDCGHEMSGYQPPRFVNKRRVARGLDPIFAICGVVLHDYGFGDSEDCECVNLVHAAVIRKPWSWSRLFAKRPKK